jgi:hypothetical protein
MVLPWLADKGIDMFGVEMVDRSPEGEPNFQARGTASPIRAVTIFE